MITQIIALDVFYVFVENYLIGRVGRDGDIRRIEFILVPIDLTERNISPFIECSLNKCTFLTRVVCSDILGKISLGNKQLESTVIVDIIGFRKMALVFLIEFDIRVSVVRWHGEFNHDKLLILHVNFFEGVTVVIMELADCYLTKLLAEIVDSDPENSIIFVRPFELFLESICPFL